jgi:asparagine synthase (glutamine-hydrolysing)
MRDALERAVLGGLRRPPCVVSFSGGRDSSAVLALSAAVARREGLPPPVPVSLRFPGADGADESGWQELVVRHLGLVDWDRVELSELDLVGPVATSVLRRHGLLWPPNTYFHEPMLERAASGSLLTGIDGDGLFEGSRWVRSPGTRRRERASHAARLLAARLPAAARAAVVRRRWTPSDWVRAEAWPAICRHLMSAWEPEPYRWDERVRWWSARRYLASITWSLTVLADRHDVRVVHPLADPTFLGALARNGGAAGLGDRTAAMRALFADLLPDAVLARGSKAYFDGAVWTDQACAFARGWDGQGLDDDLVDPERVRAAWLAPMPLFTAAGLLQQAWLRTSGLSLHGHQDVAA